MRRLLPFSLLAVLAAASGCTSDALRRGDGLTDGAGNAMYANTVMQMVDPWQRGVQDTNLIVPAVRGTQPGAADEAAADKEAQSTTSGG